MALKIFIRNPQGFNPDVLKFYQDNFEIVSKEEAEVIVVNDFTPLETDKTVAVNVTAPDFVKAPKIIKLESGELNDFTAVAELALGMMIMITRLFKKEEIKGKTLGLIGSDGRIAKHFKTMAESMGMVVVGYDKKDSNGTLKELLEKSDVVSLHITSEEKNRNWFDKAKFKRMKGGAIFLNSSRPWLVEEEGLKWALNNKLSACWFDFEMNIKAKNLVTTLHIGGSTVQSRKRSEMLIAEKINKLK